MRLTFYWWHLGHDPYWYRSPGFYNYSGFLWITWVWYPSHETNVAFKRDGGFSIPYLGYIEAIVRIPLIKDYKEYVPMLVLKSFCPFSSWVPVKLGTTVWIAKIMVKELAQASSTWHKPIWVPWLQLVQPVLWSWDARRLLLPTPTGYYEVHCDPTFSSVRVKGLGQLLSVQSCWVQVIVEPIARHRVMWGVMATNMYGTSVLAQGVWEWCWGISLLG